MPVKGKPQIKWTREVKDRFIAAYYEHGSNLAACRATGLAPTSVELQRRRDPVFADQWTRALAASQERVIDTFVDVTNNGRRVEVVQPDGSVEVHHEPASERIQIITFQQSARMIGASHAARDADPDADIAARQRVRIGLLEFAKRLGILI